MPNSPELLAEWVMHRFSAKQWYNVILGLYGVMRLVKLIVAGLDFRYSWTPSLPPVVPIVALVIAALGYALVTWAMVANAFFTLANRIQRERGRTVATGGPYRYVRHPGIAVAQFLVVAIGKRISNIRGRNGYETTTTTQHHHRRIETGAGGRTGG